MPPALIDIFTPVFFGLINELRPSNQQNTKQKNEESTFRTDVSISSGQRNLMKTYHNDANTSGITKIALKKFLDFF